jgi:hypothetical protein
MNVKEYLEELNPDVIFYEDMDDAIVGFYERDDKIVALYDTNKCIQCAMKVNGLPFDEASEHVYFNMINAYLGENNPAFATLWSEDTVPHPPTATI